MTTETCEAVFQEGSFSPVQPISSETAEGQRVRLVIEVQDTGVLSLAPGVYDALSHAEEVARRWAESVW